MIPPLKSDEFKQLETNLQENGCRDPLVVWKDEEGREVLLDGHNRYEICSAHSISFKTIKAKFATRKEARVWIIANQLGRRNLTPDQQGVLAVRAYREALKIENKEHAILAAGVRWGKLPKSAKPKKAESNRRKIDEVARQTGLSARKLRHMNEIQAYDPTLLDQVTAGHMSAE